MSNFAVDISKWVEKAKGREDLVVRKVALDLLTRIVRRSPVDTGRFRGNWLVGIGSAPTGKNVNKFDKTGASTITAARGAVQTATAGTTIYLVNNLPYARALEYGHSKQAPQGMVRITAQEFGLVVTQAANQTKREMP